MDFMTKVTINQIAEKCQVSPTTVSRYFNNRELLSEETQKKIESALHDLNYKKNFLAKMLVTGKSNLIGVIFPHLHLGFYVELLDHLIKYAKRKGYTLIVYTSNESTDEEIEMINSLISYRVKGLILMSHILPNEIIKEFNLPIVSIERQGGDFMQINSDNFSGGKLAAELLIKNKCEMFFHINNDYKETWPSFKRILGFEFALKGYAYEVIIDKDYSDPYSPQSITAMENFFKNNVSKYNNKKIGIFCSNDNIANLALSQCIKSNIKVPENIEIIGYDNSQVSEYSIYPITSVSQDISLMAQIAIDAFDNYNVYESIVPATLVKKYTTT